MTSLAAILAEQRREAHKAQQDNQRRLEQAKTPRYQRLPSAQSAGAQGGAWAAVGQGLSNIAKDMVAREEAERNYAREVMRQKSEQVAAGQRLAQKYTDQLAEQNFEQALTEIGEKATTLEEFEAGVNQARDSFYNHFSGRGEQVQTTVQHHMARRIDATRFDFDAKTYDAMMEVTEANFRLSHDQNTDTLSRLAYSAGQNPSDANLKALEEQIGITTANLNDAHDAGFLTPKQYVDTLNKLNETYTTEVVYGEFDLALTQGVDAADEYIKNIQGNKHIAQGQKDRLLKSLRGRREDFFRQQKREEQEQTLARQVRDGQIKLAIDLAPTEQELDEIATQITNDPLYNTPKGQIAANGLRQKILKRLDKIHEQVDLRALGQQFSQGEQNLNPENPDHINAADEYAEQVNAALSEIPLEERNVFKAEVIGNQRYIPKVWKGEFLRLARGSDPTEIQEAVDLYDRLAINNPHLLPQLGFGHAIDRVKMINQRINRGIKADEAIKAVDVLLDPANTARIKAAEALLEGIEDEEIDDKALDVFGGAGWLFGTLDDIETPEQRPIVQSMLNDYHQAFEDGIRKTLDEDLSHGYATSVVRGKYGVTEVNGADDLMAYPPERYYGINGLEDNADWIREQMVEAAFKAISGEWTEKQMSDAGFKATGEKSNPPSRDYIRDNMRLVVVPGVTDRTAAKGRPKYALVIRLKSGAWRNVLPEDDYWYPDDEKQKEALVERAKKKKAEDERLRLSPSEQYRRKEEFW